MGKINLANLKKTIYYIKRNGLREAIPAALERIRQKQDADYTYLPPDERKLARQRERAWEQAVLFSVLVPAYHTGEQYLRDMIASVLEQTYDRWELIIADASSDNSVRTVVEEYDDSRIKYRKLASNEGIAENTNAALREAKGEYIALLDHDDLLTPDALYEMAYCIEETGKQDKKALILYSDEDKCDQDGARYYEPHHKLNFNLDLILSNNYICHLLVVEAELARTTAFRKEYDGAQDYDFVLRAIAKTEAAKIVHIPKVLYHWRCHAGSTAENPESKRYAYEAGGRAIADFISRAGWKAEVLPLKHLGFYRVEYEPDIFTCRKDVGLLGGRLLDRRNKITGGIYGFYGDCPYEGLPRSYSGYMHRAALRQEAEAVDIRLMKVNPAISAEFQEIVREAAKAPDWQCILRDGRADWSALPAATDYKAVSREVCKALKELGYGIVWDPAWTERIS